MKDYRLNPYTYILNLLSDAQGLYVSGFIAEILQLHSHSPVVPLLLYDSFSEVFTLHHAGDLLIS